MMHQPMSHLSPKLEARRLPSQDGWGVYAHQLIRAGELLVVWTGDIVPTDQFNQLSGYKRQHSLQIEETLYLVPVRPDEPADFVNHSCDPNAGLSGQISLVALRDIAPDEEITFDYAMSDGSPYDEFECGCGAAACRGWVTGNDWKQPVLWERYEGYFSPYLQRRINKLRRERQVSQFALNGV